MIVMAITPSLNASNRPLPLIPALPSAELNAIQEVVEGARVQLPCYLRPEDVYLAARAGMPADPVGFDQLAKANVNRGERIHLPGIGAPDGRARSAFQGIVRADGGIR